MSQFGAGADDLLVQMLTPGDVLTALQIVHRQGQLAHPDAEPQHTRTSA